MYAKMVEWVGEARNAETYKELLESAIALRDIKKAVEKLVRMKSKMSSSSSRRGFSIRRLKVEKDPESVFNM